MVNKAESDTSSVVTLNGTSSLTSFCFLGDFGHYLLARLNTNLKPS